MLESIKELLRAVRQLPATAPQSDKLSMEGYETHQDHWIGWLKGYDGPGYYGRSDWSVDARAVYQRLANGHILLWLSEAAGEDPKRIRAPITAMWRHGNRRAQTEAKIVRLTCLGSKSRRYFSNDNRPPEETGFWPPLRKVQT
jgi:hypothetical protein